jgi:hypothetical protein
MGFFDDGIAKRTLSLVSHASDNKWGTDWADDDEH